MFTEKAKRVNLKLRINKSTSGTFFNRGTMFVSKETPNYSIVRYNT